MTNVRESPPDQGVPGLGLALRMESLFEMLTERLPECSDGVRFVGGRLVDVQYTPGVGAQVLWKIKAFDPETGRTGRQLLFVRALRVNEAIPPAPVELIDKYGNLRASKEMARAMPLRTPWIAAHDARVIVHAFPLDPAMPSLLNVAHPEAMKVALQHLWHARGARVTRVHIDTLSYTPGMRAALQYEILAEDGRTSVPELRRLVGKIDVRRPPARLFAGHWAVWRQGSGRLRIAPPVGYVAVARLSLQEFLTGTRLSDITRIGELKGRVRKAAHAIATVHALKAPVVKHRSVEKEMSNVERWGAVLSQIRPAQAARLAKLSSRLRRELAERMRITATIHADFHLANILTDRDGVILIDWDQAAHGDPMLDVGRLIASLRVASLRLTGKLDGLDIVGDSFLEAYLARTHEDAQRARLFEASSLITAAATPFRLQREGWEESADLIIDEVERVLDLSLAGPRVPGTPLGFKREIAFSDRPSWATDKVYAQALLVLLVHDAYGTDVEVTETKPRIKSVSQSRIYIGWSLKGYKGDERWSRAVEGVGFPATSGRNILHRLELSHAATASNPSTLQLPRPIGRMAPLSLVVFEPPRGERFVSLLGTKGESASVDRLALALAQFHSLDLQLTKERNSRRVLMSLERRIHALDKSGNQAVNAGHELVPALSMAFDRATERRAPTILPLSLRSLRVANGGFATSVIHDVVMSNPLLNVASLIAELTLNALEREAPQTAAERFRGSYLDTSGVSAADLAIWEATLMLRLACVNAMRRSRLPLSQSMIDIARERLEAATPSEGRIMAASFSADQALVNGEDE